MALWPFGKKKKQKQQDAETEPASQDAQVAGVEETDAHAVDTAAEPASVEAAFDTSEAAPAAAAESIEQAAGTAPLENYDPINGSTGPFDGDSVEMDDFDFSDFSNVTLDLGSMRIPLPLESQVQVEMGEQGPKMVHVITRHGRLTPVAFAAPRTGGLWEKSVQEILEGMRGEGMPTHLEQGPWGTEVVGTGTNGAIRIIGVEGPRWLYRLTVAAPSGHEEAAADLARETVARSFIYRGDAPVLAGNSLTVTLPGQLAAQVQQAVEARAAQQQGLSVGGDAPAPGNPNALSEALQQILAMNRGDAEGGATPEPRQ